MRLRLYHHSDGARIAYREAGAGPPLALLHSLWLSHREFEPVVERLQARFRVVLPDLPLHGDSEIGRRHAYSPDWLIDVLAGFCAEVLGPDPLLGGHDLGAELLLLGTADGRLHPRRLVLMPNRLHGPYFAPLRRRTWQRVASAGAIPGAGALLAHAAAAGLPRMLVRELGAGRNRAVDALLRDAFAEVGGSGERARAWSRFARRWPVAPQRELLERYGAIDVPVLLLWAEDDRRAPAERAREALARLPHGQLRTLPGAGFLMAYDDPVGVARELIAFCG